MKYDYFLAGRWRNHQAIRPVLEALRSAGKSVYCFTDNAYDADGVLIETHEKANADEFMARLETLKDWKTNPTFKKIFENDMNGLREAEKFVMVLPAGLSAHMELGVAYGLGKDCYAIGKPEKHETLYLMFKEIFPNAKEFLRRFS